MEFILLFFQRKEPFTLKFEGPREQYSMKRQYTHIENNNDWKCIKLTPNLSTETILKIIDIGAFEIPIDVLSSLTDNITNHNISKQNSLRDKIFTTIYEEIINRKLILTSFDLSFTYNH